MTKKELKIIKTEVEDAKKFFKKMTVGVNDEGDFINEPMKLAGYHKRMVAELKAAGML